MKLSSLLNEIKISEPETEEVTPEIVYPLFLKVQNQLDKSKVEKLKREFGWKNNYYKDNETWIYSIHPEYLQKFYQELLKLEKRISEISFFGGNKALATQTNVSIDDVIKLIGQMTQFDSPDHDTYWKHFRELRDLLGKYNIDVLNYEERYLYKSFTSNQLNKLYTNLNALDQKYKKLREIKSYLPTPNLDRKKIYDTYLEVLMQLREKNKEYILPRIATKLGYKQYEFATVGAWIGHGLKQKDFPVFYQALLSLKTKYSLKEIKSNPTINLKTIYGLAEDIMDGLTEENTENIIIGLENIFKKYNLVFEYGDGIYEGGKKVNRWELSLAPSTRNDYTSLYKELKQLQNKNLRETPEDFQNYLNNPNFQTDYSNEQKIQQIIKTIQSRIENKQWTQYSDGSYTMKIGDLYVKYYPENSMGLLMATAAAGYKPEASYVPSERILNIYGRVNPNELRHELVHYMDSKVIGGKQMAASSKARNAQLATVGTAAHSPEQMQLYYNAPEEFNAHWFEFIMPQVNQLFDDGNMPSLEQFTQSIDQNPEVKKFYGYLTDENKNRFNKRLGIYYQAMQQGRPEVENGEIEDPGFVGKLRNLFTKRAA